jgi:hypothetical protein
MAISCLHCYVLFYCLYVSFLVIVFVACSRMFVALLFRFIFVIFVYFHLEDLCCKCFVLFEFVSFEFVLFF